MATESNFKHIVRIVNTDIPGQRQIVMGLQKIKGVGANFAKVVCLVAGIEPRCKAGDLSEKEIEKIASIIKKPLDAGIPAWFVNRQRDYDTGDDQHLVVSDLTFVKENDIKRLKKIKSFRGMRHGWNLPLRGQRTKSNFRHNKGKGSLGVKRKKA